MLSQLNQQSNPDILRKMFPGLDNLNSLPSINKLPVYHANPSTNTENKVPIQSKMTFKELLEFKTLPCPVEACPFYPRTTVANNQYLEAELGCHYYHHAKDQRRKVIPNLQEFTGEFKYQANYFKEGKSPLPKERYSQNFFESLYHPLYYKQFACKREHCDKSIFCPYFHNQREKLEWELVFEQSLKVNRQTFLSTKARQFQGPDNSPKSLVPHENSSSSSSSSGSAKSSYSPFSLCGEAQQENDFWSVIQNEIHDRRQNISGNKLTTPFISNTMKTMYPANIFFKGL